jgi:hypothetical protein
MKSEKPIEEIIIEDHNETRQVFKKYCEEFAKEEKLKWYRQMVYLLAKHSIAEEIVLYPLVREHVHNGNILADQDIEQHRRIKEQLVNIQENVNWDSPEFDQRVKLLWQTVIDHMDKEENEDLTLLRSQVTMQDRINAGKKFENRKLIAPSRPHINAPDDNPTLEMLVGLLVAPVDKFKDLFVSFPEKSQIENLKTGSQNIETSSHLLEGTSTSGKRYIK